MKSFQVYPVELDRREHEAIMRRREIVAGATRDAIGSRVARPISTSTGNSEAQAAAGRSDYSSRPEAVEAPPSLTDTIGLGLSGGGVRSATFCLGFLQALAKRGLLRQIDWLSTVSGGGYAGAFLGRFYDRLRNIPAQAPDIVETALANPASGAVSWLRKHGDYIAPAGKSDWSFHFAAFVRNLVTVHFVVGLLVLSLYGLVNALRYGLLESASAVLPYLAGFSWMDMPLGWLVHRAGLGHFWSPWFVLVELVLLLLALPKAIAYWLASQDETEGYSRPTLIVVFVLTLGLLWAGVRRGFNVTALLGAAAILLAFPAVEWTWRRVRHDNAAVGSGGAKVEQVRTRTRLTRAFGMWLAVSGVLLYLAIVDTLGHALFEAYVRRNVSFVVALSQLSAGLMFLFPILRGIARFVANQQSKQQNSRRWSKLLTQPAVSALLAVLLMAPPLIVVSYAIHALFRGGDPAALSRGLIVTVAGLVLSGVLAWRWAMPIVNRSSLQSTYAARIARAFLGASNPNRRSTLADDVVPGDDVDTLTNYKPFEAGGPVHLINICVNQTIDEGTLRSWRDRLGVSMACSAFGLSIGRFFHAFWVKKEGEPSSKQSVEAVGHVPGTVHPLLGADGQPPEEVDVLPLRDWVAISGAAFGPGMGKSTSAALSVLFYLANLRTGYWWNSGLSSGDRGTRPRVSFVRRVMWLLPKLFATQQCLLNEAFARFRGPWDRFWYLSDGGHFDNLGGYELIRRRVPFIILVDAGADPNYDFGDLGNLQRRVRIDFQAELEPVTEQDWANAVEDELERLKGQHSEVIKAELNAWNARKEHIATSSRDGGPLDQLISHSDGGRIGSAVKKHAALFHVKYPRGNPSLLLYVKASLSGDEPADVLNYHVENPDFPFESTADQFFGEPQWESYRRLGEHIGDRTLGPMPERSSEPSNLWLTRFSKR